MTINITDSMLSGALSYTPHEFTHTRRRMYENLINWFEIPVTDMARAIAFYEQVMQISLRRETMDGADWPYSRMLNPDPAGADKAG